MPTETRTQPLSTDQLIDWTATNLEHLNANETITPFTLTAIHPGLGHLRASNALHALANSGLLHSTAHSDVYALRADLPTSGDGHVWFRVNNRASAPVEVIGDKPRPGAGLWSSDLYTRWMCHGCTESDISYRYPGAVKDAQKHAEECRGQHLSN